MENHAIAGSPPGWHVRQSGGIIIKWVRRGRPLLESRSGGTIDSYLMVQFKLSSPTTTRFMFLHADHHRQPRARYVYNGTRILPPRRRHRQRHHSHLQQCRRSANTADQSFCARHEQNVPASPGTWLPIRTCSPQTSSPSPNTARLCRRQGAGPRPESAHAVPSGASARAVGGTAAGRRCTPHPRENLHHCGRPSADVASGGETLTVRSLTVL